MDKSKTDTILAVVFFVSYPLLGAGRLFIRKLILLCSVLKKDLAFFQDLKRGGKLDLHQFEEKLEKEFSEFKRNVQKPNILLIGGTGV